MRRFRSVSSLLFLLLAVQWAPAQAPVLRIEPACPITGTQDTATNELQLTYFPQSPAATLKAPQRLMLDVGINGRYFRNNTRTASFVPKADGSWQATLTRGEKEFWLYLIFQVKDAATDRVDDNGGRYWDVVFGYAKGGRHFQGVLAQARTYTGFRFDNGVGRTADYGKAVAVLEDFMKTAGQDGYNVLADYWDYKVRRDGNDDSAWKKTAAEISQFVDDHRADRPALIGAFNFSQMHDDHLPPDLYPRLMHYLEVLDPKQAEELDHMATRNRMQQEKDPRKRAEALGDFVRKYPNDPGAPSAAAERFQILRERQDVPGAEAVFQQLVQFDPNWADSYAAMAAVYIENSQKLDNALKLLDQAEQLNKNGTDPASSQVNFYVMLVPDAARNEATLASWRARALLRQGQGALALAPAQKALLTRKNSDDFFLVAQALEASGAKQKAVDSYMEAVLRPSRQHSQQMERLERLWINGGFGTNEQLQQKLEAMQDASFRGVNYKPRLVDRPAPPYEFTTLRGEKLRSGDLRDKTVVLNFWATWCAPCIPELPGFVELQRKHPDWVVAGLVVSSDAEALEKLIREQKLDALRIAQGDSVAEAFGKPGVPVTYVIDHGRIRVIHNQPLSNVVAYIEADVAAAKDSVTASSQAR